MKKLISMCLSLVMVLALMPSAFAAGEPGSTAMGGFTDVRTGDYFAESVKWAVEKGITSGTSATTFSPAQNCTVAQILTFLWRANGSPKPTGSNPFSDVRSGDYYADAAVWAYEKGMVSGTAFGGNTPCTRAMAVTYIWKAAGSPSAKAASFTDVPASADYAGAVAWAVEQGVTAGTSAITFSPDNVCTRGQIVTFLYRGLAKAAGWGTTPTTETVLPVAGDDAGKLAALANQPVLLGKATLENVPQDAYGSLSVSQKEIDVAAVIHDEMWATGKVTSSMTQVQKAEVYYNWMMQM